METEIRWLRIEQQDGSLIIRADMRIQGVLSMTNFRLLINAEWHVASQPYGVVGPEIYRFSRVYRL